MKKLLISWLIFIPILIIWAIIATRYNINSLWSIPLGMLTMLIVTKIVKRFVK